VIRIGRARFGPWELVALGAALAAFGYLAWDQPLWDPRLESLLHLLAAGTMVAAALLAWRGAAIPRTPLELPVLVLLVVLGLATLASQNLGLSARSLATSVTWALLLPVAIAVVARRPAVAALTAIVPVAALAAASLASMIATRAAWFAAGAPGLPPVRLSGDSSPFGSVAIAPFVLAACLVLTLLIDDRRVRLWAQAALILLGLPLTVLSGSRSAWLAFAVTAIAMLAPAARRLRIRPRPPTSLSAVAGWLVALVGLAAVAAYVAPRLTAVGSLIYRENLWRDTLRAWSAHPWLGIGPGVMPYARQAAAPAGSFPVHQPHSHDLALGVLGDAGVVGLAAALALLIAFVWIAGPHRSRTMGGRFAASLLIGFAVSGIFEDLTFLPGFDLLVLLLAATALLDAGVVRWHPLPGARPVAGMEPPRVRTAAAVPAVLAAWALVLVAALVDSAGISYRVASDRAWALDWTAAERGYEAAVALDPWHPMGPKALAVAADAVGDQRLALASARRAVELNPGDAVSWANIAILCEDAGDRACALEAAGHAVASAAVGGREVINAAIVYEKLGEHDLADDAYRRSMLITVDTTLAMVWPRQVDPGTALPAEVNVMTAELDLLVARTRQGEAIDPQRYTEPAVRALAYAIGGDRRAASDALATAEQVSSADVRTWDLAVLLQRHWGEDPGRAAAVSAALRGSPLGSDLPSRALLVWDLASFRPVPGDGFVQSAERLLPARPWPFELDRVLPGS